jgi:hypothetical protein
VDAGERVLAVQALDRPAERPLEARAVLHEQRDEERKAFRIRLRPRGESTRGEFGAQLEEVFEDAVVNDDDLAVGAAVGVRVVLGRRAVRGPAGVTDPDVCPECVTVQPLQFAFETDETSCSARDFDVTVVVLKRDAGAVVAPVFETAQAVEQDGHRVAGTNVPHYSAHVSLLPMLGRSEEHPLKELALGKNRKKKDARRKCKGQGMTIFDRYE